MPLASAAHAAPGDLDPTFGDGGCVVAPLFDDEDYLLALALQSDGRIVAAGETLDGDVAVARFLADGDLDPSFGDGGTVRTHVDGSARGLAIGLQQDGKIVVAGGWTSQSLRRRRAILLRYERDGRLDRSFGGGNGVVRPRLLLGSQGANDVAIQPDGKIVAAGFTQGPGAAVAGLVTRHRPNGRLDRTFGRGGKGWSPLPDATHSFRAMALQADGKLLLSGHAAPSDGTDGGALLARILPDGRPDPGFGSGGAVISDVALEAHDLALQSDGKTIVVGPTDYEHEQTPPDFALARYHSDGRPDEGFGDRGRTRTDFGGEWDVPAAVALQGDGKVVVAGTVTLAGQSLLGLARYTSGGALDPTFGPGGTVATTCGAPGAVATSLLVQPDGGILVGGYDLSEEGHSRFVLARYLP